MSSKDEIATILRDNVYYSPQVQGVVVHGAIEKLEAREEKAYVRGFQDALFLILAIAVLVFLITLCYQLVNYTPSRPTPEQQMEDTIPTSLKEEIKSLNPKVIIFAHPIQEDSL